MKSLDLKNRPIGVFDSGVGGLTVVSALTRVLPNETILYLGDTARLPYGTKSPQTVARYTRRNIEFLAGRGVKAVVIACNTASALGTSTLDVALPTWEVIKPGARAAAQWADRGPLGVLATESTTQSGAYPREIHALVPSAQVLSVGCPLFVPLVEEGWSQDEVAELVARRYLQSLIDAKVAALVLGCTHYPVLAPILRKIVGPEVGLVDSAQEVAVEVARELAELDLLRSSDVSPEHHFCVTDDNQRFHRIARELLGDGRSISLEWVEV